LEGGDVLAAFDFLHGGTTGKDEMLD